MSRLIFLDFVRVEYIKNSKQGCRARETMSHRSAVTSGVRAKELCHLDIDDIRFGNAESGCDSGKVAAAPVRGSGLQS